MLRIISCLQNFTVSRNVLLHHNGQYCRAVNKYSQILDAAVLPMPDNVDFYETTRFSPRRNREVSATVIVAQHLRGNRTSITDISVYDSENASATITQDPHVQSYDCFGTINLNASMQSNVPSPFGGMHKFSHLNMPRGQWSQESKFMSHNLQNSHYTVLRKNSRTSWSTYGNSKKDLNQDSRNIQTRRGYCGKPEDKQRGLSKKEQLKKAFQDYGSTIIVFHIAISLTSLGCFYLLISSGIDVIAKLEALGYAPSALQSNAVIGASNFVIAYAIHKIFAPVRISLTLGAAPFIVRYLRSRGFLKQK